MQGESPTARVTLIRELPHLISEGQKLSRSEVSWEQRPHVAFFLPKSLTSFQKASQGPYEFVCDLRGQKRAWVR